MDEIIEQGKQIVALLRNLDSNGWHKVSDEEALAVVTQALKTAYSAGLVDATKHTSKMMLQALDAANA